MKRRHLLFTRLAASLAAVAALGAAPAAFAAAYTYQAAAAGGSWYDGAGLLLNTNFGQLLPTSDGSKYNFVTCVGPEPGSPGCTAIPGFPEPDAWYKMPTLPTSAAAQAHTPDYGVLKARAWSSGTSGFPGSGFPYAVYGATAESGWVDGINTTSAVPIVITFVMSLHVNWNDGGAFGLSMGRPGVYDPDVGGATPMEGRTWANCETCLWGYNTGSARTLLPGGDNGSADLIITLPYVVYPASFADPEDPNPFTNHFEAVLSASAGKNGAEVEGFSTVTLQAILVPPNAGLSFASGHAYNVQVVPEPATYALWLLGLAGVAVAKRGRARSAWAKTSAY